MVNEIDLPAGSGGPAAVPGLPGSGGAPDDLRSQVGAALTEWVRYVMANSMRQMHAMSRERGLSVSQMSTLFRLLHTGELGTGAVAEEMGVSTAAASQLLDDLVRRGLVSRREDERDRRVRRHAITPEGKRLLLELKTQLPPWLREMAADIPEAELAACLRTLACLNGLAAAHKTHLKTLHGNPGTASTGCAGCTGPSTIKEASDDACST